MSDRNELGRQMAEKLYAAERALDAALAEIGDLAALMTRGRMDHGIAAVVGQEALEYVAKCGGTLTKARRALIETGVLHGPLAGMGDECRVHSGFNGWTAGECRNTWIS